MRAQIHSIIFLTGLYAVGWIVTLQKSWPTGTLECNFIWYKGLRRYNKGKYLEISSSWVRMGLKCDDRCLIRNRKGEDIETERRRHSRTEAEMGRMQPEAKECQGCGSHQEGTRLAWKGFCLRVSRMNQPCRYFYFGLLTPGLWDNTCLLS